MNFGGRLTSALALFAALLLASCMAANGVAPADDGVVEIDSARALLRPDGQPPIERQVTLRHRWDEAFPGAAGHASYRLTLPPRPAGEASAVLLERVGNQVVVSIDGTPLERLGGADPGYDAGKAPRLVIVPPGLLKGGQPSKLRIDVTLQALRGGGLSPVRFGPRQAIEARFAWLNLLDQSAPAAYAASLLLMGGLAAGLWWRQRDPMYGIFALAAVCGAARHLERLWPDAPMPWPAWGALLAIAYGWHLALIARFVLMAVGASPRWLVGLIHATLAAVLLLASASFAWMLPGLWTGALVMLEATGVCCLVVVTRAARGGRSPVAAYVLAAGGLLVVAGLHDLLTVRMALVPGTGHTLTPHALFFVIVIMAGLVVERYSATLRQYRALNAELAERIARRETELAEAFEVVRQQREDRAVLDERQRIMREIHDGVGSQLVGLLNMVRQPESDAASLEQHVNVALDEMRMAVDSLQPVHSDLTTVLATLRYRLQPRLQAAGITVVWEVCALPPLERLSPNAVLQVQRILLEAFTNVLKHARATRVVMNARWLEDAGGHAVRIELSDNGIGPMAPGPDSSNGGPAAGHGVANMQARAAAIGAVLRVEPGEATEPGESGGTRVVIEWPVDRGVAS